MSLLLFMSATGGTNLKLTEDLKGIAETVGADTELIVLERLDMPLFNASAPTTTPPPAAELLIDQLRRADALVLIAPEYNGSIPPVVTNAITWMSLADTDFRTAFNGRYALIGSHSGGGGHRVLDAMRQQLNYLGMIVLPRTFLTNKHRTQSDESARAIFSQLLELLPGPARPS